MTRRRLCHACDKPVIGQKYGFTEIVEYEANGRVFSRYYEHDICPEDIVKGGDDD